MPKNFEVIIVGAGPAGLSAALVLGRCRRSVLICDAERPRNKASHAMHCFLSRDGTNPRELLRIGKEQLRPYSTVALIDSEVVNATRLEDGFQVQLINGVRHTCGKLLVATGVIDHVPRIEGIDRFYGRSVHHCAYCDGWEHRDQRIAVYGRGEKGFGLALMLTLWSKDLVLCTDGPSELSVEEQTRLIQHEITLRDCRIARLEGTEDGILERIVFTDGQQSPCQALFFNTGQRQRSPLLQELGCDFTEKGGAVTESTTEETNVPGLYVAGDASRDVQLVIVAAAEGAKAAFAINRDLLVEAGLV